MRTTRLALVVTVAITIAALSGAGADGSAGSAARTTDVVASGLVVRGGDPTSEAIDSMAWENSFALAATAIEEAHPESFSWAGITGTDPDTAAIRFVGPVPRDIERFFAQVPSSVRILLTPGEAMTASQVDEAVVEAHHAVAADESLGDIVTSYDREAGVITTTAERAGIEGWSDESVEGLSNAVLAGMSLDALPVELTLVPDLNNGTEQRTGGGRLEVQGQDDLECTSGFNVSNASGVDGVATAGHCGNDLTHENNGGDPETVLFFRSQHRGDWGDFQWHISNDNEPAIFYWKTGSTANVTGRGNPVDNQTLCRYGRKTGRGCSTVADLSTCATLDGIETCRLVRMDDDTAQGGDSGGPWYSGNTAYGFHTGQAGCGFFSTCDIWSKVTLIDDALGVTVKTN